MWCSLKTKEVKGVAKRAYGKAWNLLKYLDGFNPLKKGTKLPFVAKYVAYENRAEVEAVNKWPTDEQIVKWVNRDSRSTARNKAQTAVFDAAGIIKPTVANDDLKKLQGMYKILIASDFSHEDARAECSRVLKLEWPDNDTDIEEAEETDEETEDEE